MALAVILGFISMLVLYWVPIAMEDNERSHMNTVKGQFADLKNTVDHQIKTDDRNTTRSTPIELGADGFPMFERESSSQLSLKLNDEFFNFSFEDSGEDIFENSTGNIELRAFNRYYVRQTLIYENGAVVLHQKRGNIVTLEPNFIVDVEGSEVALTATLISLHHDTDDSITGAGQESVSTRLWYTDTWTYTNITSPDKSVNLTIVSRYTEAWEKYYDDTLSNAGLVEGLDYDITSSSNRVTINIENVASFQLSHAFVEAYIGKATT